MKKTYFALLLCTALSTSAFAETSIKTASSEISAECARAKQQVVIISFIEAKNFGEARSKFDQQLKQVKAFAGKQHVKQFVLNALEYGFNANRIADKDDPAPAGVTSAFYRLKATYQLASQEDAFKVGEYLASQKINVNVGMRNPCNAQSHQEE